MADYNSNAAYDLSRFAPSKTNTAPGRRHEHLPLKPEALKEKIKTEREIRDAKKRRQQKLIKFVSISMSLLFLACMRLSANVKISQLDKEFKQETALLNTAQSEGVRLTTEIEKKYSFDQLQSYTKLHGMQKSESYQMFYVNTAAQDKVTNYLGMPAG